MQVHVAADVLPANSPAKPILTRALELMRQVIEEGRNTVRGLRSSDHASLALEDAFAQIQNEFGRPDAEDGPQFRIIVDGAPRTLHPLMRDEVYRIGREALINAFRHARANHIEVELRYSSGEFRLLVRDDGTGIDSKMLESRRDRQLGPGRNARAGGADRRTTARVEPGLSRHGNRAERPRKTRIPG